MDLGVKNLKNTRSFQENPSYPCRQALGEGCAPESRGEDSVRNHSSTPGVVQTFRGGEPFAPGQGTGAGLAGGAPRGGPRAEGKPGSRGGGRRCPCAISELTATPFAHACVRTDIPPHGRCTRVQLHKCTRKPSQANAEGAEELGDTAGLRGAGRRQSLSLQPWVGASPACAPLSPKSPEFREGKSFTPTKRQPCTR